MGTKSSTKTEVKKSNSISVESPDKIERIRDLIVGPHLRDMEQKLVTVTKDLARIENELSRVSGDLKEKSSELKKSISDAEKRLAAQIKENRSSQDEVITQIEQSMGSQVRAFEKQFTDRIQELLQDLRESEESNRAELRRTAEEMDQVKMDRFSLGELFSQLGNGLKASKPDDEISQLLDELQQEIE